MVALLVESLRYKPKIVGSIPDGVIEIFQLLIPLGHTVVLESIRRLTEMSTKNVLWGVKQADE
jgi:hypothetical protein